MSLNTQHSTLNTFRSLWPIALFFFLSCLFLWRIFTGEVFVPAELLRHVAPWSANYTEQDKPLWNPLMYDSVGQFYPWRKFASDTIRSGTIPLWNPYQFCGTPFVANSQSAVFYPGNFLFYLLPTDIATGWSVILHLTLAASFMWLFVRALGVSNGGAVISGIAFAFSAWQVSWLHLPTFLTTSCWLPLVLLLVLKLFESARWQTAVGLGFAAGMALLAGHLQIAFYVLLAAILLAIWLAFTRVRESGFNRTGASLGLFALALALAGLIAGSQLLPTLELSRASHRAGAATEAGYAAYERYAPSGASMALLLFPDFFGNPSNPRNPYFGVSKWEIPFNYAENAAYAGAATLLLAFLALFSRSGGQSIRWFLGFLALLALLMALGTWVSRLFYFYVPGFASSGSPGRALVLFAFAIAALAGLGFHALVQPGRPPMKRMLAATVALMLLGGFTYAVSQGVVGKLGGDPQIVRQHLLPQLALIGVGIAAVLATGRSGNRSVLIAALPVGLVAVDLFANGLNYNPTARRSDVYPLTDGIRFLQRNAGHERIMPLNQNWSFAGPKAVMPPNAAMVYGLRDVQGYDSLFPKQYKAFLDRGLNTDASPPQVGNMVFVKALDLAFSKRMGVRYAVPPVAGEIRADLESEFGHGYSGGDLPEILEIRKNPGRASLRDPAGAIRRVEDRPTRVVIQTESSEATELRLADQFFPGWVASVDKRAAPISRSDEVFRSVAVPAGTHTVRFEYRPAGFRFGLFLMGLALGVGGFTAAWTWTTKGTKGAVSTV